jgi:hypothetical protein
MGEKQGLINSNSIEKSFLDTVKHCVEGSEKALPIQSLIELFEKTLDEYFPNTNKSHSLLSTDPDLQIGDPNFEKKLKVLKEMVNTITSTSQSSTNAFFNNVDSVKELLELLKIKDNDNKNTEMAKNFLTRIADPQPELSMKSTAVATAG